MCNQDSTMGTGSHPGTLHPPAVYANCRGGNGPLSIFDARRTDAVAFGGSQGGDVHFGLVVLEDSDVYRNLSKEF